MDGGVITFIVAVAIVAVLVFIAVLLTDKRKHVFDKEAYQIKFLAIENKLDKENSASFTMAILEADKLLDKAMIEMGLPGKTMGDRLKKSGNRFTKINAVWHAHKLRNAIAHETGFEVTFKQSQTALAAFKQALKDLGAI